MTARLACRDLRLSYGGPEVVHGVSLDVPDGAITTLVGANGCGKSTLLRGLARLLKPAGGQVTLDGTDLHSLPTRQVATTIGLLPQQPLVPAGLTVAELVTRGRHPHRAAWRPASAADHEAVEDAMRRTDTLGVADRPVAALSGGQRQRVWIAMALAQQTDVLMLDEPTSFLDLAHQVDVLDLVAQLNVERGTTVVMVLHDLNLAARVSDHLVAMAAGQLVAAGTPREVITEETVREVFGLDSLVVDDPVTGTPMVVPRGRVPARAAT
ncbi:cobalamin/Fe(3+)-siderophore ABC transporter ATP-binding protein [Kytococcus schroeteri]|uniref:Cobalamin/Fe(3+)-siderophore ABC transporter ATP-binding protein n=1 Tax=Kytococcus schroeteri TaxID=138300 RepID=A0A2I1PBU3_9MICO|nr:ABC transporter ATP-binding protein [Kytococcus schroeteri]PKZ42100.1 cobalamin/Fe(3+)-siderophore ABC transporter ATP-binding protein [Kytococcus schroeteri]